MTNFKLNPLFSLILILACSLTFMQCKKDDDAKTTGKVTFEMTDAPIDNAEVQGAFVTVTEVKADGQTFKLDNKQTINLLAYQNGNTKSLGIAELEAGTYSNVTLVLDFAEDANGNAPGCYVLTTDNKKHNLNIDGSNSNEITFTASDFSVEESGQSTMVIDFDLRKAIKNNEGNAESSYAFVTNTEMKAALRAVVKAQAGTVGGNCANANNYAERVVVYAYKKGNYSKNAEMEGQGSSNVEFSNAVTSAVVASNGDFSLHFLEAGEYEIHLAAYDDSNNDGKYELKGSLETSIIGSLNLLALSVEANATVSLNITAIGLLPL